MQVGVFNMSICHLLYFITCSSIYMDASDWLPHKAQHSSPFQQEDPLWLAHLNAATQAVFLKELAQGYYLKQ